jgi:hypothetical protein
VFFVSFVFYLPPAPFSFTEARTRLYIPNCKSAQKPDGKMAGSGQNFEKSRRVELPIVSSG